MTGRGGTGTDAEGGDGDGDEHGGVEAEKGSEGKGRTSFFVHSLFLFFVFVLGFCVSVMFSILFLMLFSVLLSPSSPPRPLSRGTGEVQFCFRFCFLLCFHFFIPKILDSRIPACSAQGKLTNIEKKCGNRRPPGTWQTDRTPRLRRSAGPGQDNWPTIEKKLSPLAGITARQPPGKLGALRASGARRAQSNVTDMEKQFPLPAGIAAGGLQAN